MTGKQRNWCKYGPFRGRIYKGLFNLVEKDGNKKWWLAVKNQIHMRKKLHIFNSQGG